MWKTIPTRGSPFWRELACGRSAVPQRNASSSSRRRNPNCRVFDGPGNFCGATCEEHVDHDGWYGSSSWWRSRCAATVRDASGAGTVGRGRLVGVRAVVAADEEVVSGGGLDYCVGRIGDGEAGIGERRRREEVVKIMLAKEDLYEKGGSDLPVGRIGDGGAGIGHRSWRREEVVEKLLTKEYFYENFVMGAESGVDEEVTMHGGSAVDGKSVAVEMELEAGSDRVQDGGSKRDAVRCKSDVVNGGAPRLLSQRVRKYVA